MPQETALRTGDRVAVPWGVDVRQGEVSAIYQTGDVLVTLDSVPGLDDPQTVVLPAEVVRPLSDNPDLPAPGTWLLGYRYEREVAEALGRIFSRSHPDILLNAEVSGREVDVLVNGPNVTLVVEVKSTTKLTRRSFESGVAQLIRAVESLPNAKGILVTPGALPAFATRSVEGVGLPSGRIGVIRWRSADDDAALYSAVSALLGDYPDERHAAEC